MRLRIVITVNATNAINGIVMNPNHSKNFVVQDTP